jgi:hypothetical protein
MAVAGEQGGGRGARRRRVAAILAVVIAIVLMILGPLAVRAGIEGRAELRAAEQASTLEQAIVHLGRAARWRLPIADHDEQARERLEQIAEEAEQAGDARALVAWRELRGALLGTRTWGVVDPEQLERANRGIVRETLKAAKAVGAPEESERWLAELEAAPASDGIGTRIAALCFALWCVTLIGFVVHAIGTEGRLRRSALAWGAVNLTSLLGWLLTM